jgi:hypothetical protein
MLSLAVPLQHLSFPDDFQRLIGAKTHRLAKFLWFGLQGDTRKQYASAVRSYTGFMQIEHPREKPWPVQEQFLCEFAAWRLEGSPGNRKLVGTSMEQYISGIRSYHVDRGWDTSAFSSETLRRIIKGAHNIFGYEKRVRCPITRDILEMITASQATTPLDANLRACYLLAFAAFLRLGEVTYNPADVLNKTRFLQTKVTRSCIRFSPNYDHLTLYLKRSKTDVDHKGVTILVAAIEGPFCTIAAMRHLFVMDPQPNDAPLFNFNGLPFTKDRLQKALKASLQYANVPTQGLTLHSFRKGAAQHAKDSGIRDEQIQAMGRWTSSSVNLYFTTSPALLYSYSFQFQTSKPLPFTNTSTLWAQASHATPVVAS